MPLAMGFVGADGGSVVLNHTDVASDGAVALRDNGETVLLEAKERNHELCIKNLSAKPVVSFLREFSAPVKVSHQRNAEELAFLVEHDTDGFVRWDAMQTLWMEHFDTGIETTVDPVATLGELAKDALALESPEQQMLAASMLAVPNENYLFEQLSGFDVDALLDARDAAVDNAAQAHAQTWEALVAQHDTVRPIRPMRQVWLVVPWQYRIFLFGKNAIRCRLEELLQARYAKADNLTDRRTVLGIACRHTGISEAFKSQLAGRFLSGLAGLCLGH